MSRLFALGVLAGTVLAYGLACLVYTAILLFTAAPPEPVTPPAPVASTPRTSAPPDAPLSARAVPTRAARSRPSIVVPKADTLSLSVTAYCWTGNRTASGAWPVLGTAAGNRWPFGTRIDVPGVGVVTITDRIGHGSELDLYLGREGCEQRARAFGRRQLRVAVLA